MEDGLTLESRGTPTVTFCTEAFASEARAHVEMSALPDFQAALIPHPLAAIPRAKVRERAEAGFRQFERILGLSAQPARGPVANPPAAV